MPFGSEGLVIPWIGPIPRESKVNFTDGRIFSAADRVNGRTTPAGFPKKYSQRVQQSELFNSHIAYDMEEARRWHARFSPALSEQASSILEEYTNEGYEILATLLQHPPVDIADRFAACSVILQRAVLVSNPPRRRQTIFLRSYMHSAADAESFVNFAARGGLQISYESESTWFPLRLTSLNQEPVSYVVLDILTPEQLDADQLPQHFQVEKSGKMEYQGSTYQVARVTAELDVNNPEQMQDLIIKA